MLESILKSIKTLLGVSTEDSAFDVEIMLHINSAFMVLHQLGVGSDNPFFIESDEVLWSSFTADINKYLSVKQYIYKSVRLIFDPPTLSSVLEAFNRAKQELEWRLCVQVPIPEPPVVPVNDE